MYHVEILMSRGVTYCIIFNNNYFIIKVEILSKKRHKMLKPDYAYKNKNKLKVITKSKFQNISSILRNLHKH